MCDYVPSHGLRPARLLGPWNFPGKSIGVGCHFLLQGIFPTWGLNPVLPHRRQTPYPLSHQGSPRERREIEGRIKYLKSLSPGTLPLSGTADSEQMSSLTSGRDRRHEEGEPGQRPEREKAWTSYDSAAAADASLRRAPV